MKDVLREITPLNKDNIFFTAYYPDNKMDYPLHFHEDFELNLTLNGNGSRIVGNQVDIFTTQDLILVGPNILHCYKKQNDEEANICDVYIVQFNKDLHLYPILATTRLHHIKDLLNRATNGGIKFSNKIIDKLKDNIKKVVNAKDFEQFILFLELLNDLAKAEEQEYLTISMNKKGADILYSLPKNRRINKIIEFVELNYRKKILLEDIGEMVGMSSGSVSKFFKKKTQHNFSDFLNFYRVNCATQMLIETELFISEVCYSSGFENISNFNRVFKEQLKCTPSEYRTRYRTSMIPNK